MSVYKEAMHIIGDLKDQQVQIYSDASDFGIPIVSEENDSAMKDVISLKDQYFSEKSGDERHVSNYGNQLQVNLKMHFIDEFGDGKPFEVLIQYIRFSPEAKSLRRSMHGEITGILSIYSPKW